MPKSSSEAMDCVRDDVLYTPQFQGAWWCSLFLVVMLEVATKQDTEYAVMVVLAYLLFTLPCLRFCCLSAEAYQRARFAVMPADKEPPLKEHMQKKMKAMTEEEALEAARSKQSYRAQGDNARGFAPTVKSKRASSEESAVASARGKPSVKKGFVSSGNRATEDNAGGIISELKRPSGGSSGGVRAGSRG